MKRTIKHCVANSAFVVLVAMIMAACSGPARLTDSASPDPMEERTETAPSETAELEALYEERIKSARMRFTDADVDFMTGMIAHHAQALVMSDLAPKNGASPSVQTLASRIINAQNDEIATMQQWLKDRDQPVPEVHIMGTNLMVHGAGDHHMHMPGMLTQAQLDELAEARDTEFDRLFLTYMIDHHAGAVTMVHKLFSTDGAGQDEAAFKLASDVQVDQITEINRMKLMLDALPDADQE